MRSSPISIMPEDSWRWDFGKASKYGNKALIFLVLSFCVLGVACSSNNANNNNAGTGGLVAGTGGMAGSGGVALTGGTGGVTPTGGTGGVAPTGGAGGAGGTGGAADAGGTGGADAGVDAGGGGAKSNPGCGSGGGKNRGKTNQTVTVGSASRTFVLYAPSTLDANMPVPLVIVPHGFTMSGEAMFTSTGYDKIADREGFVVAYPDGQGATPWYVGTGICGLGGFVANTNDVDQDFMNALIEFVDADQCVDLDHIYISGFSMGGYFSHETACMNPAFRAAGPHSGGTHDLSSCVNQHRPVIIFHFENDSLISYTCATDARDKWVAHNGCDSANPDVTQVKGGTCEYYKNCPADGQVVLCHFQDPGNGGELVDGHAWSGGTGAFGIPSTESASELGWAFFKKYAW